MSRCDPNAISQAAAVEQTRRDLLGIPPGQERLAVTPGFRLWCERDEDERIFMLAQNNFAASFRLIPGWDQRTSRRMIKN
jgi:hypothetical protein